MKLNILTDNLKRAVNVASKGVSGKAQLPILSNILLKATKKGLVCIGTDLMVSLKSTVGAQVEEEGEILIPVKVMSELVGELPLGTVQITKEKHILKLEAAGVKVSITGQATEEFPEIGEFGKGGILLSAEDFIEKVLSVAVAAAKEGIRPVFEGILYLFEKEELVMVATDGFRLSIDRIRELKSGLEGKEAIVPVKAMVEWARLMEGEESKDLKMKLDLKKQIMLFAIGGMEMSVRLIGGDFPDFKQILPSGFTTKVIFAREDLEASVRRAMVFARGNANIIYLNISKEGVVLKAEAAEVGSDVDKLDVKQEGENLSVAFNAKYLLDYLAVVKEKEIVFETNGDLKPGIFKLNKGSYLYIVMPIKN